MPPRRKNRGGITEIAAWINGLYEFDSPDDYVDWPSWKRLPDFLDDLGVSLNGDPSIRGWRIYPDGRIEVVVRGEE